MADDKDELRKRKKVIDFNDASSLRDKTLENKLNINIPTYPYKSSAEYAAAVNRWLWQCYNWQCMTLTLPYLVSQTACRTHTNNADGTTDFNRNFPNTFFPNQNLSVSQPRRPNVSFQEQTSVSSGQSGTDYIIPSLFKRFAAEVIDFCILLVLKVMITYIAMDFFDLVNLDKYDLDLFKNDKLDYHKAMEVTSEIIALEIIHRFVVCIFEALCIHKGIMGNGGATPGKSLMRLRVVSCHSVVPIDANIIRVYPAGDIGIGWAMLRAFIKNFSLAFIFPICFTMFFFQHNRTAYDLICNSIVVEEMPNRAQRN
ncbi:protein FAM8A1-like [Stegodyphus dumicola]|uniref:protein FAM8A1-like n=1 Tax=Stegodyphus dumicola TaxID=202533 RepID=UPI0015AAFEE1|nr:protein FAM8A1-like [Stegodyphus dumicola]